MNRVVLRSIIFIAILSLGGLVSCIKNDDIYDPQAQFEKEQDLIDAYLDANDISVDVDTLVGLRYKVHALGNGELPKEDDWTLVSLRGQVLNGAEFVNEDSLYIPYENWILGYEVLLRYIREGGSMTMYIPSPYGYGRNSGFDGKLTENSSLILDVELKETLTLFDYEQRKIDQYILEEELEAQIDTTESLRYVILEDGTGAYPTASSTVNVDYSLYILGAEEPLQSGEGFERDRKSVV